MLHAHYNYGARMNKRTFAKLEKLVDVNMTDWSPEDRAAWLENVDGNELNDGYTVAAHDETGYVTADYELDEMEFASPDVKVYDYAADRGDSTGDERFYEKDVAVFQLKADGTLWVLDSDDLLDF